MLITAERIVKICDFGLAKDCYACDEYVTEGGTPLPVKWMAIESIRDNVFTTKSDVWSFGITIWEIFSLGANPYPGMAIDGAFWKELASGYRMEKPELCPSDIYSLVEEMWNDREDERPTFLELKKKLRTFLRASTLESIYHSDGNYMQMNRSTCISNQGYLM